MRRPTGPVRRRALPATTVSGDAVQASVSSALCQTPAAANAASVHRPLFTDNFKVPHRSATEQIKLIGNSSTPATSSLLERNDRNAG
jgi:hypothetical protein